MEEDGCTLCGLFGGPHTEHSGRALEGRRWRGRVTAADEERRIRERLERMYREARELEPWPEEITESEDLGRGMRPNRVILDEPFLEEAHKPEPVPLIQEEVDTDSVPELVEQLLQDALRMAYPGQRVRFTAEDRGTGERRTWEVVKPWAGTHVHGPDFNGFCNVCGVPEEQDQWGWTEAQRRRRAVSRIREELEEG